MFPFEGVRAENMKVAVKLVGGSMYHVEIEAKETGHDLKVKLYQLLKCRTKDIRPVFGDKLIECHTDLDDALKNYTEGQHITFVLRLGSGPQSPFDSTDSLFVYSSLLNKSFPFSVKEQDRQCCYNGPGSQFSPLEIPPDSKFYWHVFRETYGPDEDSFSENNIQLLDEKGCTVGAKLTIVKARKLEGLTSVMLTPKHPLQGGLYTLTINDSDKDYITTLPRVDNKLGPQFPGIIQEFVKVESISVRGPPGGLAFV